MADMQQTLSLILSAKDEASTVLKQVGDQVAALGQQAERIMAGSEGLGLKVERPEAIKAALAKQLEVVTQSYAAQIAEEKKKEAVISQTAEEGRQARYKVTRQEMLDAARERERDIQSAQRWASEQAKVLEQVQQKQQERLYHPDFGQAAMLDPAALEAAVKANAEANATMAEQNKAGLSKMVADADAGYRARVNAAEDAKDHELAIIATTEETQRTALQRAVSDLQGQKDREVAIWKAAAETEQRLTRETAEAAKVLAQGEAEGARRAAQQAAQAWAEEADRVKTLAQASTRLQKQMAQEVAQAERETARAARQAATEEAQAAREAAAAAREAAAATRAAARGQGEGDILKKVLLGPLGEMGGMGRQMLVWNTAYQIWGKLSNAVAQTAGDLVTINAQVEQLGQTFGALYHTTAEGGRQMVDSLNKFAALVPATREEVHDAAVQFAAAGDNVSKILQPASDLAAIMGATLPDAAHAMVDAQMGRFEMLQMTLKTTKQELLGYGLQIDGTGHVLNNSFVPAIERYAAARFGEHLAMDARSARQAGEDLYFSAQQVQEFHKQLAVPMGSSAQRDIQAAAQIAAGAMPAGTSAARRTAVLTETLPDLSKMALGDPAAIRQMHDLYGVTAGDLDKISKNWRSSGEAAQQAFAKWLEANYGGQKALQDTQAQQSAAQRQMHTLTGLLSNVKDAGANLLEVMGKGTTGDLSKGTGIFNVLRTSIQGVIDLMNNPVLISWAAKVGAEMGRELQNVVGWIGRWGVSLGGLPGILARVDTAARIAGQVFGGLWDAFHNVILLVMPMVHAAESLVGALDHLTGASKQGSQTIRTLVATGLDLYLLLKVAGPAMKMVQGGMEGLTSAAGTLTGATRRQKEAADAERVATDQSSEAKARNKLATDTLRDSEGTLKTATVGLATAEGEQGLTRATNLAKDAEGNLKTAVVAAKDAEVVAKTATMDLSLVLGENGLAMNAGTATRGMEGLAAASGEAGAAGAMGTAEKATSRLGGVLGGIKGLISSSAGQFALLAIDVGLVSTAVNTFFDDLQRGQQVQQLQDAGKALLPTGAQPGQPIYEKRRVGRPRGGYAYEQVQVGTTTASSGDVGAFGHYLYPHGGAQPLIYQQYGSMQRGGDPRPFIQSLLTHPDILNHYRQMMQKEGRWDQAQASIQQIAQLSATGGGLVSPDDQQRAQNQQAYDAAYNTFRAALKKQPDQAMADLDMVKSAYQTLVQGTATDEASIEKAMDQANKMYNSLLALVPAQYRDQSYLPGQPADSQSQTTTQDKGAAGKANKALSAFVRTTWAKTVNALRAGTIGPEDVGDIVTQYEQLQTDAGQTPTDTAIHNQIKAAVKTYATSLISKFHHDLGLVSLGKITQQALQEEAARIQGTEAGAGITDYHDYGQDVTNAFDRHAKTVAKGQVTTLVNQYKRLWDRLQHHYKGVTVDMVASVIANIQQTEIGGGLQDTTGMMTQHLQDWQQKQATAAGKTVAAGTLTDLLATRGDDMAHFNADIKHKHYADASALIDTIVNDTELIDKARHRSWDTIIKDDDAVRTRLNASLPASVSAVAGGAGMGAPAALYGPYRPLAPQYGATQVAFGGPVQQPLQALIAHLRALATYWQHRAMQDEQALSLQRQTANNTKQIVVNTQSAADKMDQPGRGLPPAPAPSVGGTLRGWGTHYPVPR